MRLKIIHQPLQVLALLACLGAATASAQDFGGLLKGFIQTKTSLLARPGDLLGVIKSVSDVSFGQIAGGSQVPPDAEGRVVLYRTSWCGYCKRAATYMQQKNIPFIERDIEINSTYKAEYTQLGGKGPVPFMIFGNKTMLGFTEASFNQNYAEFQRTQASKTELQNPSATPNRTTSVGTSLQSGDTLVGKISGIQVYSEASKAAPKLMVLGKSEEIIYMGEEHEGLYRVTSDKGEGWVDKLLVKKR